jgi:hypothetical protein
MVIKRLVKENIPDNSLPALSQIWEKAEQKYGDRQQENNHPFGPPLLFKYKP